MKTRLVLANHTKNQMGKPLGRLRSAENEFKCSVGSPRLKCITRVKCKREM